MLKSKNLKAYLAFIAVAIFWGTTFLAIRIGIHKEDGYYFPPFLLAAFRHCIAGVLICSYFIFYKKQPLPTLNQFKYFSINGILMLVGGNGIISWGMQYVDSGLAAILCALTPLWIVFINLAIGSSEKVTKVMWAGFIICLLAQYLIFYDKVNILSNQNYIYGLIAIVVSNICWAFGTVFSKSSTSTFPVLYNAGLQMIPGGFILLVFSTLKGDWQQLNPSSNSIWAMVYLIVFGSLLAYGCFMYIIKALPAALVSTYAYFNTIVAVILGVIFLNEPIDEKLVIAMFLTILGVYLVGKKAKVKETP
ncbi:MAG: EamA family transporter [Candidatus Methylacidiphilales bacterium]